MKDSWPKIDWGKFSNLKDLGVVSVSIATGDEALEWLTWRGFGEEKDYNKEYFVVEVSWGYEYYHALDWAEFCNGPDLNGCVIQCLENFVKHSDYRDYDKLGVEKEKFLDKIKELKES